MTHREIVQTALRAFRRRRRIAGVPVAVVPRTLKLVELLAGPTAFATWDEAELLEVPMVSARGTADAERLGVVPRPMQAVLGSG